MLKKAGQYVKFKLFVSFPDKHLTSKKCRQLILHKDYREILNHVAKSSTLSLKLKFTNKSIQKITKIQPKQLSQMKQDIPAKLAYILTCRCKLIGSGEIGYDLILNNFGTTFGTSSIGSDGPLKIVIGNARS